MDTIQNVPNKLGSSQTHTSHAESTIHGRWARFTCSPPIPPKIKEKKCFFFFFYYGSYDASAKRWWYYNYVSRDDLYRIEQCDGAHRRWCVEGGPLMRRKRIQGAKLWLKQKKREQQRDTGQKTSPWLSIFHNFLSRRSRKSRDLFGTPACPHP